jgi:DNA-binding Lrp family transcriptional regulator
MQLTEREVLYIKLLNNSRKTIYELAEELDIHYQTVLTHIRLMQSRGLIKEHPIRKGKAKLYFTTYDPASGQPLPKLPVVTSDGSVWEVTGLISALLNTTKPTAQVNNFAKAIFTHMFGQLTDEVFGSGEEYRAYAKVWVESERQRLEFCEELFNREELWNSSVVEELSNWTDYLSEEALRELALETQQDMLITVPSAKKRWEKQLLNPPTSME